ACGPTVRWVARTDGRSRGRNSGGCPRRYRIPRGVGGVPPVDVAPRDPGRRVQKPGAPGAAAGGVPQPEVECPQPGGRMSATPRVLGRLLVEAGAIGEEQLESALEEQRRTRERLG